MMKHCRIGAITNASIIYRCTLGVVNLNVAPAPLWNYFQSPRSINAQVIALSATGGVFVENFKLLAWPNRAKTSTRREFQ